MVEFDADLVAMDRLGPYLKGKTRIQLCREKLILSGNMEPNKAIVAALAAGWEKKKATTLPKLRI